MQDQGFRPSKLRVDAAIRAVSLVLCNDKLTTYGAPDVLQVSVDQLDGHFYRTAAFADRPPNQARLLPCLDLHLPSSPAERLLRLLVCMLLSSAVMNLTALDGRRPRSKERLA